MWCANALPSHPRQCKSRSVATGHCDASPPPTLNSSVSGQLLPAAAPSATAGSNTFSLPSAASPPSQCILGIRFGAISYTPKRMTYIVCQTVL